MMAKEARQQAIEQAEVAKMEAYRALEAAEQARKMLEECQQRK